MHCFTQALVNDDDYYGNKDHLPSAELRSEHGVEDVLRLRVIEMAEENVVRDRLLQGLHGVFILRNHLKVYVRIEN